MPATSSSSSGGQLYAVWLYQALAPNTLQRIALIDVPSNAPPSPGPPEVVTFSGNTYVWNKDRGAYIQVTPFVAALDTGRPPLSVVCNPTTPY